MVKLETFYKFADAQVVGTFEVSVKGTVLGLHTTDWINHSVVLYEYKVMGSGRVVRFASLYGRVCDGQPGSVLYPVKGEFPMTIDSENWWIVSNKGCLILCEEG